MGSTTLPPPLWSIDMHNSPSLPNSVELPLYKNQIETESVRSVLSDRSRVTKQQRGQSGHHGINHTMSNNMLMSNLSPYRGSDNSRHHNQSLQPRNTSKHTQHSVKNDRHCKTKVTTLPDGSVLNRRRNDEVIEVQIIPQDDTWGDNTTVVTGNTSDHSVSIEMDLDQVGKENFWSKSSLSSKCLMWSWPVTTTIISFCAFISPIIMIILPKIETYEWKLKECGPECDGQLINFAFKLLILLICTWALFFRTPRYTLPRICNYRSVILAIIVFLLIAYWLFYSERILDKKLNEEELSYYSVVQFAISFVDVLLWTHYASIILIEIKQLQPTYFVKVVRSPDGESHFYNIGELSIQRAAIYILQRYYQDFTIYNPYLELLPRRKSSHKYGSSDYHNPVNLTNSTLKYYNVDGRTNSNGIDGILLSPPSNTNQITDRSQMNGNPARLNETVQSDNNFDNRSIKRSRLSSHHDHHHHHHHHNDRFYEEYDYERRVKKRKARLLTSVEEAFTHIKRIQANESGELISFLTSFVFHIVKLKISKNSNNKKKGWKKIIFQE